MMNFKKNIKKLKLKFTRNIAAHNFSTDDPHVTNSFLDNSSITENLTCYYHLLLSLTKLYYSKSSQIRNSIACDQVDSISYLHNNIL